MRLPNGYGSVVRLKRERMPYQVRTPVSGYDERGYPIFEIIGYAETRADGLAMLAEYNANPWNLKDQNITLKGLFEWWLKFKTPKLGKKNTSNLKSVYKYIEGMGDIVYKRIKAPQMQETIDNCGAGPATQKKVSALWGHLDNAAIELDIPVRGFARLVKTDPEHIPEKHVFTEDEISRLWDHAEDPGVDSVLVLLYSGWRISELLSLSKDNIDLEQMTMRGGSKTEAGKNRVVPIHHRIAPIITERMNKSDSLLFDMKITRYREMWWGIMKSLGMDHTPHECRHTFRTRLDAAGANKKCCDLLMGHKSSDIGNRVYNHKTLDELREAVELLL